MRQWMQSHKYPFTFNIQSSINLADDEELMAMMAETGFTSTFVGIETPDEDSLQECNKAQNKNRDLLHSVKKIQNAGLQVSGGFIVGFDTDTPSVFQKQIDFIQQSGIVSAMVGLLNAPKNTVLYKRLKAENRLTNESSGNNTDSSMNFVPKMDSSELLQGYKKIIQNIYSAKPYYKRIRQFLLNYKKLHAGRQTRDFPFLIGFIKSVIIIGIVNKGTERILETSDMDAFQAPDSFNRCFNLCRVWLPFPNSIWTYKFNQESIINTLEMKTRKILGIWMDHSVAHLTELHGGAFATRVIESKLVIPMNAGDLHYKDDSHLLSKEQGQLSAYYKKLSDASLGYEEVILFGPTEAKNELANILKENHLFEKINIVVKPADKMTENEQHEFLKEFFNPSEYLL